MTLIRSASLVVLLAATVPATALAAPSFEEQVGAASARYAERARQPDATKAVLEGHISQSSQMLMQVVPDERKTAVDWFVLANMLYRADPVASEAAMKKAEALRPDEPGILLERAMEEHRAHRCEQAIRYYDRFHATSDGARHATSWAYATHCHLVLGQRDKALAAWQKADFRHRHVGIEEAMYEIFSTANPDREREALVVAAGRHDRAAPCELMELDTHWETNWWNSTTRKDYLEQDTLTGRELLKDDAPAAAEFELCHDAATLPASQFVSTLKSAGLWGEHPRTPQSSRLAYMAVRALESTGTATPKDVLAAWGDPLAQHLAAAPTDRTALDLLAHLYVSVDDQARLRDIDRQGWKTLHLGNYAASYIIGRMRTDEPYEADLQAAFADFPDNDLIAMYRLRAAKAGAERERAKLDVAAAAFANVANPHPAEMRLSDYMGFITQPD